MLEMISVINVGFTFLSKKSKEYKYQYDQSKSDWEVRKSS